MPNITKRGDNYRIKVFAGYDAEGRQIVRSCTFKPDPSKTDRQNKKALEVFAIEFEQKVLSGKLLDGERMTFQQYVETVWLPEYAEKQLAATSYEDAKSALERVFIPAVGNMKLSQIQPLHIQKILDDMQTNGYEKYGKKHAYSTTSIKRYYAVLSSCMTQAVYWQLIEDNPCRRVRPPKAERKKEVKAFTLEEAQTFLSFLDEPYTVISRGRERRDGTASSEHEEIRHVPLQLKVFYYMSLFGGFRRGELLALTWDDVDFDTGTITINKSRARTQQGVITKTTKNQTSDRSVVLPTECMELLRSHQIDQKKYRLAVGTYWKDHNMIFTQDNGKPLDPDTPSKAFRKIIKRYNAGHTEKLPEISLHGLRHTSATLLISGNLDVKTISARLGHADTSTTLNIYSHALKKRDEEAALTLGEMLGKNKIMTK